MHFRDRDLGRHVELRRVRIFQATALRLRERLLGETVRKWRWNLSRRVLDSCRVGVRRLGREDVKFRAWNLVESGYVGLEVLGKHVLRDVCGPVGELHGDCE